MFGRCEGSRDFLNAKKCRAFDNKSKQELSKTRLSLSHLNGFYTLSPLLCFPFFTVESSLECGFLRTKQSYTIFGWWEVSPRPHRRLSLSPLFKTPLQKVFPPFFLRLFPRLGRKIK